MGSNMRLILLVVTLFLITINVDAAWQRELSVGNDSLDSSAIYQVNSTLKGSIYAPLMTLSERNAITSPATGLGVFSTSTNEMHLYDGSGWVDYIFAARTQILTNKTINADSNTITNIEDADIKAGAEIERAKLSTETANYVLINNGSGVMSEEQFLNKTRGGTGITSTATFPASGVVVTEAGIQTLTLKKLTGGLASTSNSWAPPSDTKANLDTLCASLDAGTIVQASDKDKFYHCDGITLTELGGSGQGGINYITNFGAEEDATGWATYLDSGDTPTNGTGGSPTNTYARNVSTPLRGAGDFKYTKGATTQGEGFSYDFTIDDADRTQLLRVAFDHNSSAANYDDGDLRVYIYNVDSAFLIEVAPRDLAGGTQTFEGYYQTSPGDNDYRLIIHVADNSTAYDVYFDNFLVGPQSPVVKSAAVVLSAYGSATQNLANTIPFTVEFNSSLIDSRSGLDSVNDWYEIPESGDYYIGGNIATQNILSGARRCYIRITASIAGAPFTTIAFLPQTDHSTASTSDMHAFQKVYSFNKGDKVQISFQSLDDASYEINHGINLSSLEIYKLVGDNSSGSAPAAYGYVGLDLPSSGISGTPAVVKFGALDVDSHANYNLGTGEYNCEVSGPRDVSAQIELLATYAVGNDITLSIRVDGNTVHQFGKRLGSTQSRQMVSVNGIVDCDKDSKITIYAASGGTSPVWASSLGGSSFSVKRVTGSSSSSNLTARYSLRYSGNSLQSVATSTTTIIDFEDLSWDDLNSFNPAIGVSRFTAKRTALYHLCVGIQTSNVAWTVGTAAVIEVYKMAVFNTKLDRYESDSSDNALGIVFLNGCTDISLDKGEWADVRFTHSQGGNVGLGNGPAVNWLTINEVK